MKHKKSVMATLSLISQLGISMIVPVFLCIFIGIKLEEKIDFPFTILFIILGILAGIRNVYALIKHATNYIHTVNSGTDIPDSCSAADLYTFDQHSLYSVLHNGK